MSGGGTPGGGGASSSGASSTAGDAAVGGSTPTSGSGGEASAEHCEGTPTGTCAAPLCDTYPGCVATEESSCSGAAEPCSAYDDKTSSCGQHWGCGPGPGGVCQQWTSSCSTIQKSETCNSTSGCSWQNFLCVGTPRDCTPLTHSSCDANAGCRWQESKVAWCNGAAISCTEMASVDCARQAGCAVEPASCSGTPAPCAPLSKAECGSQPGCQWMPGGNAPLTPVKGSSEELPDLAVSSVSGLRDVGGTTFTYGMVGINRGTVDSSAVSVTFYLSQDAKLGNADDVSFASKAGPALGPQGFDRMQGTFVIAMPDLLEVAEPGSYYLGVIIDPDNELPESEEQNNALLAPDLLYIGADVLDLTAVSVSSSAAEVDAGKEMTLSVAIKNNGNVAVATAPVQILVSTDGAPNDNDFAACTSSVALGLAPGASGTFTLKCPAPLVRGARYLIARIDPGSTLGDANYVDNWVPSSATVQIKAASPDLVVQSVTSAATLLKWHASSKLTAQVKNAGTDPTPASGVAFYLSEDDAIDAEDPLLCSVPLGALAAGSSASVSDDCAMPTTAVGTFQLLARADYQELVFETDEDNNVGSAATALEIAAPDINLKAGPFSFSKSTTTAGSTIIFNPSLGNLGNDPVPAFRLNIYLSPDTNVTTSDTLFCYSERPALGAQQSTSFEFSCVTPSITPGSYYVGFVIDPDNAVPETVETDNTGVYLAGKLTVQ